MKVSSKYFSKSLTGVSLIAIFVIVFFVSSSFAFKWLKEKRKTKIKMTEKFLKAKHWQLFLLTFGIPMIFQFVMMGTMFAKIGSGNNPDPSFMFSYLKFFPIMMILFMGVFFGWFWSVVIGLQKVIPAGSQMKLKRFKIFFFIPLVYILFFSIFIGGAIGGITVASDAPNPRIIFGMIAIILPLHLLSIFSIFHSLYFVAKAFKTAIKANKTDRCAFAPLLTSGNWPCLS